MKVIKVAKNIKVGAVAVFNSKGEVLILQRSKSSGEAGKWNLPGGHIEKGESEEEGALRELKEEADITATNVVHFCHYSFMSIFIGESDEKVTIDAESTDFEWVTEDELDLFTFVGNTATLIKNAIKAYTDGDDGDEPKDNTLENNNGNKQE